MQKETTTHIMQTPWQLIICPAGEKCWCRGIEPAMPITDAEGLPVIVLPIGLLPREVAEHIVQTHNATLKQS